ncbi:MAG: hypothetical protein NC417_14770 [Candidatus Gastranaerophilales bacterium]|nr:hypothetical protein [Candidatus Gastranaerophilales bacterium]MCM1528357.1 hypothetical protein [Bacteroides sp.]
MQTRKNLKGSFKLEDAPKTGKGYKVHIQKNCQKVHTKAVHEPVPGKDRKGK